MAVKQSLPLLPEETVALGDMADECVAAIAELGPSPSELTRAQSWLALASASVADTLSINGLFQRSGAADDQLLDYCEEAAAWAYREWNRQPGLLVSPEIMIGSLLISMDEVDDDDPEASDWLWSTAGPARKGNSAKLTDRNRHLAHLNLISAAVPSLAGMDSAAALASSEAHARSLVQRSSDQVNLCGSARTKALIAQTERLNEAAAVRSELAASEAAKATVAVFDATAESMKHLMIASCAEAEFVVDAYGWTSLSIVRLHNWRRWVNRMIDSACAESPEEPFERMAWWSAADLLMRAMAYEAVFVDEDGSTAVRMMAYDLIGRPIPEASG